MPLMLHGLTDVEIVRTTRLLRHCVKELCDLIGSDIERSTPRAVPVETGSFQ